jgi:hypothetical protein
MTLEKRSTYGEHLIGMDMKTGKEQHQNGVKHSRKTVNAAAGYRAGELTNIGEVINR